MKKILLLVVGCIFSINAYAQDLTEKQLNILYKAVGNNLKDADSAKYKLGDFFPNEDNKNGETGTYCGLVNAKNAMGGYTGFQPFIMMFLNNNKNELVGVVIDIGGKLTKDDPLVTLCKKDGYDLLDLHYK